MAKLLTALQIVPSTHSAKIIDPLQISVARAEDAELRRLDAKKRALLVDNTNTANMAATTDAVADMSDECGTWALDGECCANPEYMMVDCASSCANYPCDGAAAAAGGDGDTQA